MKPVKLVIEADDIKIRKKSPPPAKPHKNPKAYRRRPKHVKKDADPGSGPSIDGPFFLSFPPG